jgi:hypothetical protein
MDKLPDRCRQADVLALVVFNIWCQLSQGLANSSSRNFLASSTDTLVDALIPSPSSDPLPRTCNRQASGADSLSICSYNYGKALGEIECVEF